MKLELKHLASYLSFNLKIGFNSDDNHHELVGLDITSDGVMLISPFGDSGRANLKDTKPILRPLSDIEFDFFAGEAPGKMSDAIVEYFHYFESDSANKDVAILSAPYVVFEWCLENHFDVFSLIPKGLAIDINTLPVNG